MNRGGNWGNTARNCRSAYRNNNGPGNRNHNNGLRACAARRRVEHIRRTGQGPVPGRGLRGEGQTRSARRVW